MATSISRQIRQLVGFSLGVGIPSLLLFSYLAWTREVQPVPEDLRHQIGQGFGVAGLYAMLLLYGRSLLKLVLASEPLLARLLPGESIRLRSVSLAGKLLTLLNRTHRYLGGAAVVALTCHALLMGPARWNLFLVLVLALILWQGSFGLVLAVRAFFPGLKRFGYQVHAQLYSGVMIGIFAGLGHLLV